MSHRVSPCRFQRLCGAALLAALLVGVACSDDGTSPPDGDGNAADQLSGDAGGDLGPDTDFGDGSAGDGPTTTAAHPFMGIGMVEVHYWSRAWVFTDLMEQATWQADKFRVFAGCDGHYPPGPYTVVPAGAATVSDEGHVAIEPAPGYEAGNFSVYLPGYAPGEANHGQRFHPLLLERLAPFRTIRFMDTMRTNDNPPATWAERIKPHGERTEPRDAGDPLAIEDMIDLVNEVGADPWFNMPHNADDNYVRKFAELVKTRLHPQLKVYVEYSNELWNWDFSQHDWVDGQAQGPGNTLFQQVGVEAKRDWDIWLDVFSGEEERVVRVIAGQAHNVWHVEQAIDKLGPAGFDAISCTAYIGIRNDEAEDEGFDGNTTIAELFAYLDDQLATTELDKRTEHADLAQQYGVPLLAYEAGQHVTPQGSTTVPWAQLFEDAQRHSAMYTLTKKNMKQWKDLGGSLYMAYYLVGPINQWGGWGHLEWMDQQLAAAHKYRALIDFAAEELD